MTDPKNEKFDLGSDEDFDFNKIAEYESTPRPSDDGPEDFTTFGDGSGDFTFDDDKATFPSDDDNSVFAGDFDAPSDFQEQENNPFDFGGPPSPESVELDSLNGDPDQEFGDFGGDDKTGGFHAGADDLPKTFDPFAEADDAEIPEEQQQEDRQQEETAAPREQSRFGVKQIATLAAVVAVVGYVGYSQVVPIFLPQDTGGQVVADAGPSIEEGVLAPSLPPISTNVEKTPVAVDPVKDIGNPAPVGEPVSAPPQLTLPGVDTGKPVGQIASVEPKPVVELPAVDAKPAPADPIGELVGGADRGGITSMKDVVPVAGETEPATTAVAPVASDARFEEVAKRFEDVVKRIETIERRVSELAVGTATAKPETAIRTPVAVAPTVAANPGVSAPLKPPIIETAVLRGVSRDVAWIAIGKDVVEVKVGDTIPDAGVVESFQNYRGRWIAVTDKGIILPR
jgi:hypothetical protein